VIELHAIFRGKVQGVGFRWTIVDHAEKFQLKGTVQNLPNGTVEVYAQGPKEALEAFIESVNKDSGLARIDSLFCEYKKPDNSYHGFQII